MTKWPVVFQPRVDSTMDWAKRMAPTAKHDVFRVEAGQQWAGRGRGGHVWHDRAGEALLTTCALRRGGAMDPGDRLPSTIALRAGLAVLMVLDLHGLNAAVRWPNDILIQERKVCGILVEADPRWFFVGIGLNRRLPDEANQATFATAPGALDQFTDRLPGLAQLSRDLDQALEDALAAGNWKARVQERLLWLGQTVRWSEERGDGPASGVRGRLVGLGDDGELVLDAEDGTGHRTFVTGSVRG